MHMFLKKDTVYYAVQRAFLIFEINLKLKVRLIRGVLKIKDLKIIKDGNKNGCLQLFLTFLFMHVFFNVFYSTVGFRYAEFIQRQAHLGEHQRTSNWRRLNVGVEFVFFYKVKWISFVVNFLILNRTTLSIRRYNNSL